MSQSLYLITSELVSTPSYLATYLLVFFIGLTVASSGSVRQHWTYLGKTQKRIEKAKVAELIASNESTEPVLLDKYQVMKQFSTATWQRKAYEAFAAKLGDKEKTFPCIYASNGWKDNDLIYMFLPSEDITERRNVPEVARAILAYVPKSHEYGLNTSLVVLTPNSAKNRTVEDYHALFWQFLKSLRQLDPKAWPPNIVDECESNRWCMCFNGKPAFLAVLTPAHEARKSRYLPNFCFVWQPRWVFELLLTSPAKRESVLKNVRGLIDKYDDPLAHSPDISNFGDDDCSEAWEYFIYDENRRAHSPWPTLLAP